MSELLHINVNNHTEKKNNLTYLSWAWAWSEVLKLDPLATWEAVEFNGMPACFLPDGSAMVKTVVTIKGHAKTCWLPVMNHRNQAIKNPDAFAINTAIVRCLTKAISMHGLGLYIYAGEDLPPDGLTVEDVVKKTDTLVEKISGRDAMKEEYDSLPIERRQVVDAVVSSILDHFDNGDVMGAYEEYTGLDEQTTERFAAWYFLPSKVRTAIKKHGDAAKEHTA
jgi:hypothetical protein